MADDLKKRAPQDGSKINLNEDWEKKYWTDKFNTSAESLKEAVQKVGNSTNAVEKFLKKNN